LEGAKAIRQRGSLRKNEKNKISNYELDGTEKPVSKQLAGSEKNRIGSLEIMHKTSLKQLRKTKRVIPTGEIRWKEKRARGESKKQRRRKRNIPHRPVSRQEGKKNSGRRGEKKKIRRKETNEHSTIT